MKNVKILAAYLPQYHVIPENSKWWGEGYTDWVAVKKAKPIISGQIQPRVPLNDNYYSLDKKDAIKWQAELAKRYGVYGFAIYHYWFSKEQVLLTKPAEIILQNQDIDINFLFVWDNHSWVSNTWKNVEYANQWAPQFENSEHNGVLAELKYGDEESWKQHYSYLRPFFKDSRYIKEGGKPIIGIFAPNNERDTLLKMCSYLNNLAIKDGFPGLIFISTANCKHIKLDYDFRYEPFCNYSLIDRIKNKIKQKQKLKIYDYDNLWKKILFNAKYLQNKDSWYGGFVRYDDTPRRGDSSNIVVGETPQKFQNYLSKLINISKKQGKKYIYLTAWNEWGEGAYLEPDTKNGYEYLEALKRAIEENEN